MEEHHTYDSQQAALKMQQRCKALLAEFQEYQDYLNQHKKETLVDTRLFMLGLEAEMKLINKLASTDASSPKTVHALRSSNLSSYEAIWSAAKHCSGVIAFSKRFTGQSGPDQPYPYGKPRRRDAQPPWKCKGPGVDIVAKNGLEWIKVSLATEKRIIWDLAKAGWVGSSDDSDIDGESKQDDDDDQVRGLLKQAEELVRASKKIRVQYRQPKVRIELPRISGNCVKEVTEVLERIRKLGATVLTSEDLPKSSPPIGDVLRRIIVDDFANFSDILNIDCTILLAFVSDVSHGRVEPEHWHNEYISKQIVLEKEGQLLPSVLFPACKSHELVCVRDAAVTMLRIVEMIGTESEKERAALILQYTPELACNELVGDFPKLAMSLKKNSLLTERQRLEEFQKLSDYPIPPEWNLPIKVVTDDVTTLEPSLPRSAETVSQSLTVVNRSVFFYGWATGRTTLSSNGVAAKNIERIIESNRQDNDEVGPQIWLCPITRSLVGKEKTRRGAKTTSKEA